MPRKHIEVANGSFRVDTDKQGFQNFLEGFIDYSKAHKASSCEVTNVEANWCSGSRPSEDEADYYVVNLKFKREETKEEHHKRIKAEIEKLKAELDD